MTPNFSKMWPSLPSANFHCHFHPIIHESTVHQHLSAGTLSTTPSNFHITPSGGIINFSISFRVVVNCLVGHFTTTPPLHEDLEKYPPPG